MIELKKALTGTTETVSVFGAEKLSIELDSVDATRRIEVSIDGVTFLQPTYDPETTAGALILTVSTPIRAVRFTGVASNTYTILGKE